MSALELGLEGKVAIVTGGTEGIGRATVLLLARAGAKVALCARRETLLNETASEVERFGGKVLPVVADVTRVTDLEGIVARTAEAWGGVDVLVNNAGTSNARPFTESDDANWQHDLDLKLLAAVRLSRLVLPFMRAAGGGSIVNVTTPAGKAPPAGSMPTSVSRAAGLAFTKALSLELAPHRIRVNAVCIGVVKAAQHERHAAEAHQPPDAYYADLAQRVPLGRVGEAAEAANVIVFLASNAASYVTGAAINVDGGSSPVV